MKHTALLAFLMLTSLSPARAQDLPPGAARDLVLNNCQVCHSLTRIQNKQTDVTVWTATVKRMQGKGARVTDEQVGLIAAYLAAHYGPPRQGGAAPTPATPASSAATVVNAPERKTAALTVVAGQGDANGGLNFNGAASGERTFTVPLGWTVELKFSNAGSMPHSAVVVAGTSVPAKLTPAFEGAASRTLRPGEEGQTLRFVAGRAGEYLLACGVGQHAAGGGQYLRFVVSVAAKEASYK